MSNITTTLKLACIIWWYRRAPPPRRKNLDFQSKPRCFQKLTFRRLLQAVANFFNNQNISCMLLWWKHLKSSTIQTESEMRAAVNATQSVLVTESGLCSLPLIHWALQDPEAASGSQKVLHCCLVPTNLKESISLDSLSKQENFSFNVMMSVTIHFQNFPYSLNFFKIIHQKVKNTYKFITV